MPTETARSAGPTENRIAKRRKWIGVGITVGVVGIALAIWAELWPFQQRTVIENLQEASDSHVEARAFHRVYFPFPGCVLEGVQFFHTDNSKAPLINADRIEILGSYMGILTRRLKSIHVDKLHVLIPEIGTGGGFKISSSKITVDEIVTNGAVLEFARSDGKQTPLRFDLHEAEFDNVGWSGPLTYRIKMHNPEPPGEITASGKFGVWVLGNPGETLVSGEYIFDHADLSVYGGIAGTLSSSGKFGGTLARINIDGTTETPDFEVRSSHHTVNLTSQFSAYVDGTNGDTYLKKVEARFGHTRVEAEGSVAGMKGARGKTAKINFTANNGRIEDMLRLFVQAERPPMSGTATMHAKVEVPPGDEAFLKKLKMQGGFGVGSGKFKEDTQKDVNELSAGARGEKGKEKEDPETVLTDLAGELTVANGTAKFSDLSFWVPGAHSRLHGTYNLISYKIDLRGRLRVDTKISNTSSGTKAFLLKMMDPIFRKKKKGEVLPVRIGGTYDKPTFGLDLGDQQTQKSADGPVRAARPTEAKGGSKN